MLANLVRVTRLSVFVVASLKVNYACDTASYTLNSIVKNWMLPVMYKRGILEKGKKNLKKLLIVIVML